MVRTLKSLCKVSQRDRRRHEDQLISSDSSRTSSFQLRDCEIKRSRVKIEFESSKRSSKQKQNSAFFGCQDVGQCPPEEAPAVLLVHCLSGHVKWLPIRLRFVKSLRLTCHQMSEPASTWGVKTLRGLGQIQIDGSRNAAPPPSLSSNAEISIFISKVKPFHKPIVRAHCCGNLP